MKVSIPWNSSKRKSHICSPEQFIAQQEFEEAVAEHNGVQLPTYSTVSSWTCARFDPDDADYIINPKTKMFRPWTAERSEYGIIECHPVRLNDVYMSRDYFASHFRSGAASLGYLRTDPKNLKNFQDSFPAFGPEDVQKYFHWHSDLVDHCLIYGVFIPPAHTLRTDLYLGTWFGALPVSVQSDAMKHFSKLLMGCLRKHMQPTVRQEHPSIADIIQNGSTNGYKILYLLARQAGKHPMLLRFPSEPREPAQHADMTVNQYRIAWIQYLQYRLFDGLVYSDRYFLQQFIRRLHPSVNQRIGTHVLREIDRVPIERALPRGFSPDELKHAIEDFANYANLPLDFIELTPRQYEATKTSAIRALTRPSATPCCSNDNNDIDLPAIVAALNNTSNPHCFLCAAEDHRMANCPIYSRLRDNPRAITALLRQLRPQRRRTGPPREIRQIAHDTTTTEIGEGTSPINEIGEGTHDPSDLNADADDEISISPPLDTIESDFL
jgi:hypothetical protein